MLIIVIVKCYLTLCNINQSQIEQNPFSLAFIVVIPGGGGWVSNGHSGQQAFIEEIVLLTFSVLHAYANKLVKYSLVHACTMLFLDVTSYASYTFISIFTINTVNCMDMSVLMLSPDIFTDHLYINHMMLIVDVIGVSFTSIIKESKYKSVTILNVVSTKTHLSSDQCTTLSTILTKQNNFFVGIINAYPNCHLSRCSTTSMHLSSYPHVSWCFNAELIRLCDIGVSEGCGTSWLCIPNLHYIKKGWYDWLALWLFRAKSNTLLCLPISIYTWYFKSCPGYSYFSKLYILHHIYA